RRRHRLEHVPRQLLRPPTRVRLEAPHVVGQRAELLHDLERAPRVVDRALDLAAMADDARVIQQTGHVARRVETGEGAAEVFALAQDREPVQAALKSLETDFLE